MPASRSESLERLLADGEDRGVGWFCSSHCVMVTTVLTISDSGVSRPSLRQLLRVHLRVFGGVVGEEDDPLFELAQLENEPLGPGQQLVAEVDGPVEIEDVAFV